MGRTPSRHWLPLQFVTPPHCLKSLGVYARGAIEALGPVGGPTHREAKQVSSLRPVSSGNVDDAHVDVENSVKCSAAGSQLHPPVLVTVFGLSHCLLPCSIPPLVTSTEVGGLSMQLAQAVSSYRDCGTDYANGSAHQ